MAGIKTFAFLMDCPEPGQYMMFPDYVENLNEELKKYQEVINHKIENTPWNYDLNKHFYKVYKQKTDDKDTDRISS